MDGDDVFGLDAAIQQSMGELIGAGVQLGVGEGVAVQRQGGGVGPKPGLAGDEVGNELLGRRRGCVVPGRELGQFRLREDGLIADGPVGIGDEVIQQGEEVAGQSLDGVRAEECGVVEPLAVQAALFFDQGKGEIIGSADRSQIHRLQAQAACGGPGTLVLIGKHHLENRRVAEITRGLQGLDHQLEGDIGMREGSLSRGAGPGQELVEGGVVMQMQAQSQRIDKESDQGLEFRAGAVGDGCADDDVVLIGVAGQKCGKRAPNGHKWRGARCAGQGVQPLRQVAGDVEGNRAGLAASHGGSGKIGGKRQEGRGVGKMLLPKAKLSIPFAPCQPFSLPEGKIGILHRQLRQSSGGDIAPGPIKRCELAQENACRPAICDDVVHGHGDDMVMLGQAIEAHPQQWPIRQVEGTGGQGLRPMTRFIQTLRLRQRAEIGLVQRQFAPGKDALDGPVIGLLKDGAEDRVSGNDGVEAADEGIPMQGAAQTHRCGHAIESIIGLEPGQKPQTLLGIGEGRLLQTGRAEVHGDRRHARRGGVKGVSEEEGLAMEGRIQGRVQPGPSRGGINALMAKEAGVADHTTFGVHAVEHPIALVGLKHGRVEINRQEFAEAMQQLLGRLNQLVEGQEHTPFLGNIAEEGVDVAVGLQPDQFSALAAGERRVGQIHRIQAAIEIGMHRGVGISHQVDVAGGAKGGLDALQGLQAEGISGGLVHQGAARQPALQTTIEAMHRPIPGLVPGQDRSGPREIAIENLHDGPQQSLAPPALTTGKGDRAFGHAVEAGQIELGRGEKLRMSRQHDSQQGGAGTGGGEDEDRGRQFSRNRRPIAALLSFAVIQSMEDALEGVNIRFGEGGSVGGGMPIVGEWVLGKPSGNGMGIIPFQQRGQFCDGGRIEKDGDKKGLVDLLLQAVDENGRPQ